MIRDSSRAHLFAVPCEVHIRDFVGVIHGDRQVTLADELEDSDRLWVPRDRLGKFIIQVNHANATDRQMLTYVQTIETSGAPIENPVQGDVDESHGRSEWLVPEDLADNFLVRNVKTAGQKRVKRRKITADEHKEAVLDAFNEKYGSNELVKTMNQREGRLNEKLSVPDLAAQIELIGKLKDELVTGQYPQNKRLAHEPFFKRSWRPMAAPDRKGHCSVRQAHPGLDWLCTLHISAAATIRYRISTRK